MDRREFLLAEAGALVAATVMPAFGKTERDAPTAFPVALWLAPRAEERWQIQKVINQLSQENSKLPVFRAHATLCSGKIADLGESLNKLLCKVDDFCAGRKRMSLDVITGHDRIGHRDAKGDAKEMQPSEWSTFLFLALEPNQLFTQAESEFGELKLKAPFRPHVSLAYCEGVRVRSQDSFDFGDVDRDGLEEQLRKDLCSLTQVTFDGVEVVMPESANWRDIASTTQDRWNVLYARQFDPPEYRGLRCVVAGGQVGIDQTALDAAQHAGLLTGGWCPPKRETQPGLPPVPDKFPLHETPKSESTNALGKGAGAGPLVPESVPRSLRTEWNCRDSDGTLVAAASSNDDLGTIWTVRFAHDFKKPICSFTLSPGLVQENQEQETTRVLKWLKCNNVEVLNVAGPAKLDAVQQRIATIFLSNLFNRAKQ